MEREIGPQPREREVRKLLHEAHWELRVLPDKLCSLSGFFSSECLHFPVFPSHGYADVSTGVSELVLLNEGLNIAHADLRDSG